MRQHLYTVYGLRLRSELWLPELPLTHDGGQMDDVVVRFGSVVTPVTTDPADNSDEAFRCISYSSTEAIAHWDCGGTIAVRNGREIVVSPSPEATDTDRLRLLLLGPTMDLLLRQRGMVVLHASAVQIDGVCVAFMGASGWGKSTMAAALMRRGYPLVSDDGLALVVDGEEVLVQPAFPRIRLWPSTIREFGWQPDDLPRLVANVDKRQITAEDSFSHHPLPLSAIYILSEGSDIAIRAPLDPPEALIEILRHSARARQFRHIDSSSYFRRCALLAEKIGAPGSSSRIARLDRPRDFSQLDRVVDAILSHTTGNVADATNC